MSIFCLQPLEHYVIKEASQPSSKRNLIAMASNLLAMAFSLLNLYVPFVPSSVLVTSSMARSHAPSSDALCSVRSVLVTV